MEKAKYVRRIEESADGEMLTYEINDNPRRHFTCTRHEIRYHGLAEMLARYKVEPPDEPVPVYMDGRVAGYFPSTFEPIERRSDSFMYRPKDNDFIRNDAGWVAAKAIGPGDLEAIPGFLLPTEFRDVRSRR